MLPLEFTVLSKQIILNSNTASNYAVCYQHGLPEIERNIFNKYVVKWNRNVKRKLECFSI